MEEKGENNGTNKNESNLKGYSLSRAWFDFTFEHPDQVNTNHTALYFWIVELCNRLGWKEKFGLPTVHSMEALGIKSYNTYIKTLNDLIRWEFITLIQKSQNQYTSNIIALSNFNKAHNKALDKALTKHTSKQNDIIKQGNQETKKPSIVSNAFSIDYKPEGVYDSIAFQLWKICLDNLTSKKIKPTTLEKAKPQAWTNEIWLLMTTDMRTEAEISEVLNFIKSDSFWINNIASPAKLRKQFEQLQLKIRTPKRIKGNPYAALPEDPAGDNKFKNKLN